MIGERLKHSFTGNDAWVLSYREECFDQIGLKPSIKIPCSTVRWNANSANTNYSTANSKNSVVKMPIGSSSPAEKKSVRAVTRKK